MNDEPDFIPGRIWKKFAAHVNRNRDVQPKFTVQPMQPAPLGVTIFYQVRPAGKYSYQQVFHMDKVTLQTLDEAVELATRLLQRRVSTVIDHFYAVFCADGSYRKVNYFKVQFDVWDTWSWPTRASMRKEGHESDSVR